MRDEFVTSGQVNSEKQIRLKFSGLIQRRTVDQLFNKISLKGQAMALLNNLQHLRPDSSKIEIRSISVSC